MLESPDSEQNYYSRTATGFYKIEHDSFKIMNRISYYGRSCYEKKNYYDMMASILLCLKKYN